MKGDTYLSIALSINSLVTLSYIFEDVFKILTGWEFDILFLLEVPLSRCEAFYVKCTQNFKYFSGFVPQALLQDVVEHIWFLEVVLIGSMLEWSKYDSINL